MIKSIDLARFRRKTAHTYRENALEGVALIFDLDGTLVDTAGDLAAAMNHVIAADGLSPIAAAAVRSLVGAGARVMMERAYALNGVDPAALDMDARMAGFMEFYLAHIADHSRPFPGAEAALAGFAAAGARLAICTNKREPWARRLLDALDLSRHFCAIVGPDTIGAAKPDPRGALYCLSKCGAARGVFIGDSDTDIATAQAAAMPCLLASFGYGPTHRRLEAAAVFSGYDELPALVRAIAD